MYLPPSFGLIGPLLDGPGDLLNGDVEVRGEWRDVKAVVVAPAEGLVDVVIVRGWEGEVCVVWGWWEEEEEGAEVAFPCWMAEWARKVARKLAKKGRCVDIFVSISSSSRLQELREEERDIKSNGDFGMQWRLKSGRYVVIRLSRVLAASIEGYACFFPFPYYSSLHYVTHSTVALPPQSAVLAVVRWMPSLVCSGNIKRLAGSGFAIRFDQFFMPSFRY